jgi:hypothetical protein
MKKENDRPLEERTEANLSNGKVLDLRDDIICNVKRKKQRILNNFKVINLNKKMLCLVAS